MMNHPIPAIYEHGVLRPLITLDSLPEHTQVQIIIVPLPDRTAEDHLPVMMRTEDKPTLAECWAELDRINSIDYVEIELPPREDRPNPLLEMPDEFFV
jgi:predicted DNA-binding antitoxin AbrB/MazE fold protein